MVFFDDLMGNTCQRAFYLVVMHQPRFPFHIKRPLAEPEQHNKKGFLPEQKASDFDRSSPKNPESKS